MGFDQWCLLSYTQLLDLGFFFFLFLFLKEFFL